MFSFESTIFTFMLISYFLIKIVDILTCVQKYTYDLVLCLFITHFTVIFVSINTHIIDSITISKTVELEFISVSMYSLVIGNSIQNLTVDIETFNIYT